MKKEFMAWAIDAHSSEGHGYLGRYYFTHVIPESSEGCEVALFTTRAIARSYLSTMRHRVYVSFPDARVVRVKVTIEDFKARDNK